MLPLPPIHRRQMDRLRSYRSLKVYESEPPAPIKKDKPNKLSERRNKADRRQKNIRVSYDRRKGDRRLAYVRLSQRIKTLISNSGDSNLDPDQRSGRFIDETV